MANNLTLLKAHFFFLFAALGPILPFLSVIGKQLGISEIVMGSVFTVLPVFYFVAKTFYGYIVDYFAQQRTLIFTLAVASMGISYLFIYFVPHTPIKKIHFTGDATCSSAIFCDLHRRLPANQTENRVCDLRCPNGPQEEGVELCTMPEYCKNIENVTTGCNVSQVDCKLDCKSSDPATNAPLEVLVVSSQFWIFLALLSMGSICFNIVNSASDAICFNILGEGNEDRYGNQRLWGTVGYGITAFSAGYLIDYVSEETTSKNNTPAFVLLMVFISLDLIVCSRLRFPPIPRSQKIAKEAFKVLREPRVMVFTFFCLIIGMCDGLVVYYSFWFLEDVASNSGMFHRIRLVEGLTTLVQCFGGELIVFPFSGKITQKIGYDTSLSLCFFFFAIRFAALSFIQNPWWALPIEAVFQGFTYALAYATIVGYVNQISTPRIQATMQGIVSGVYDGLGYALGGFFGGALGAAYSFRKTFRIFGVIALTAGILHYLSHIFMRKKVHIEGGVVYTMPEDSSKAVTPSES